MLGISQSTEAVLEFHEMVPGLVKHGETPISHGKTLSISDQ